MEWSGPCAVAKKDAGKCFGASLMRDSELVGECLRRMKEAAGLTRPLTRPQRFGPLVHSFVSFIGPSVHRPIGPFFRPLTSPPQVKPP